MDNYFVFNGVSSLDMGLIVEKVPGRRIAQKDMESFQIPGRSEPLHIWKQSWKPYPVKYKCWFKGSTPEKQLHEIAEWLHGAPVKSRLEDSYDATVFRYATYQGGADVDVLMRTVGKFTVEFEVGAQAYLKKYEDGKLFTSSGGTIFNPGSFPTKPLIRIQGSISGGLIIGGKTLILAFHDSETHEIWIDCEEEEAWEIVNGEEVPANTFIGGQNFIELQPGTNTVEVPASFDQVTIYTRAYTL